MISSPSRTASFTTPPSLFNVPRRRRTRLPLELGNQQQLIARGRLVQAVLQEPVLLTLIQAPAGYGKTVLMAQCHSELIHRGVTSSWLTLDPLDCEPSSLLTRLLSALSDAGVTCEIGPYDEVARDPALAGAEIADVLAAVDHEVFVFLDGVDAVLASAARQLLEGLVRRAPGNVRLVVSSRSQVTLPVARLRANDQLRELDVRDLRFLPEETTAFCNGVCEFGPQAHQDFQERTEGWAAGLVMMRRLLRGGMPVEEVFEDFTGERRELSEFFAQEVLAQGGRLQTFLEQICVLRLMTPDLCDAVIQGNDSRSFLEEALSSNSFVFPADARHQWFRLHGLFAEYLRRKLKESDPQRWRALHRRACEWHLSKRMYVEAIEHALEAGEALRAAEIFDVNILESWCSNTFGSPQVEVLTLCSRLPMDIKLRFPRILLLEAWRRDMFWQFEGARDLLRLARQSMADDAMPMGEHNTGGMEGLLLHGELMLSVVGDDMPQAEAQAEVLLRDYPHVNPYLKGSFYISLLHAQRELYKLGGIERLSTLGRECLARSPTGPASVFTEAIVGPSFFMAGRLGSAIRSLEDGLKLARRLGGGSLASIVALPLAEVLYERNEVEAATVLVNEFLLQGTTLGLVDQLVSGWTVRARLLLLSQDDTQAMDALDEAIAFARAHSFDRLRLVAAGEQIRIQLGQGRLHEAKRIAREHGIQGDAKSLVPGRVVTTRDEARALAWTRLALADNRIADGMSVAKHWRNFVDAAGAVRSVVRWDIVMAHLHLVDGDQRAAQRLLRRAVGAAASGRFVRSFIDEGAWLESLLRKQDASTGVADAVIDAFAGELLCTFDARRGSKPVAPAVQQPEADSGAYGALSSREVEIMSLVSAGLLNREIGDKLGMTEGSVKWYLQRIYDKLGVRRRSQAMDKALKLGILNK